jgi:hypothetical protein
VEDVPCCEKKEEGRQKNPLYSSSFNTQFRGFADVYPLTPHHVRYIGKKKAYI